MTADRWSADQLGALADEWVAEREAFFSALQAYLATHVLQRPPASLQSLAAVTYDAELAAIGERRVGRQDAAGALHAPRLVQRIVALAGSKSRIGGPDAGTAL